MLCGAGHSGTFWVGFARFGGGGGGGGGLQRSGGTSCAGGHAYFFRLVGPTVPPKKFAKDLDMELR